MIFGKRERIEPGPGQESVWDYPRPPRLESSSRRVRIIFNEVPIAETTAALRMLETSHPPVYYIPANDVRMEYLSVVPRRQTFCEWKGQARYYTLQVGDRIEPEVAWDYPEPVARYAEIVGHLAFYPSRMDACYLDEERVQAQAGDFYGGWITQEIVGPFKGGPGTWGW